MDRPAAGDLARSAAGGARWSLVSNVVQQVGRLVFTLVLAGLIGPSDFGVVAQAVIYIGFVQLFLDQGFGTALIQKKSVDRLDLGSVFWLNVGTAVPLVALTWFAAPAVAAFFDTAALTEVLRVLSIALLLSGLAAVPRAVVNRELRFRHMAAIDIVAISAGGVAGVVQALLEPTYWAIVTQTLVSSAITLAGLLWLTGPPPFQASLSRLRAMLSFSSGMFASRLINYAGQNGDNLLVGRFLGATELAFYTVAYRVLLLPTQTLGRLVNQVAFPVYSRLQHDRPRVLAWFLLSSRATALLSYPLFTLAVVLEPLLVPAVLGSRWEPAVVPMQILTLAAFPNITLKLIGPVLMAFGRTRSVLTNSVTSVVLTLGGVGIGLPFGIVGVATGVLCARLLIGPLLLRQLRAPLGLRASRYSWRMLPVWLSCTALAAVWLAVRHVAEELAGWHVAVAASLSTVLAVAVYLVLVRLVFRPAWDDGLKVARMVLRRERSVGSDPPSRSRHRLERVPRR